MPHERKCPVCAGLDKWSRRQHAEDERIGTRLKDAPMAELPSDGRFTTMRLLAPDEVQSLSESRRRQPGAVVHESPQRVSEP